MIFCAVTGPMPSIPSSCSTVALPRLIGPVRPPSRRAGGGRAGTGHDDLLAVAEPRRQVDRVLIRVAARSRRPA